MPQSLSRIWLHIVFSTKNRQPLLADEALREEMFKMLGHHAKEAGCPAVRVGGWVDHVHVLCGLSRTVTAAQLVEAIKRETSKWAKQRSPEWSEFYWQNGYGVFSVSNRLWSKSHSTSSGKQNTIAGSRIKTSSARSARSMASRSMNGTSGIDRLPTAGGWRLGLWAVRSIDFPGWWPGLT